MSPWRSLSNLCPGCHGATFLLGPQWCYSFSWPVWKSLSPLGCSCASISLWHWWGARMWQKIILGFGDITLVELDVIFLQCWCSAKCSCVDLSPGFGVRQSGCVTAASNVLRAQMGLARGPSFFPFVLVFFAWIYISSGHEQQSLRKSLCHVPTFCLSLPSTSSKLLSEEPRLQFVPEQAKVFFGKKQKSLPHGALCSLMWPRAALSYSAAEERLFCLKRFINQILLYSCLLSLEHGHYWKSYSAPEFPDKLPRRGMYCIVKKWLFSSWIM